MRYVENSAKYLWWPKAVAGIIYLLLKLGVWFDYKNNIFSKLVKLENKVITLYSRTVFQNGFSQKHDLLQNLLVAR